MEYVGNILLPGWNRSKEQGMELEKAIEDELTGVSFGIPWQFCKEMREPAVVMKMGGQLNSYLPVAFLGNSARDGGALGQLGLTQETNWFLLPWIISTQTGQYKNVATCNDWCLTHAMGLVFPILRPGCFIHYTWGRRLPYLSPLRCRFKEKLLWFPLFTLLWLGSGGTSPSVTANISAGVVAVSESWMPWLQMPGSWWHLSDGRLLNYDRIARASLLFYFHKSHTKTKTPRAALPPKQTLRRHYCSDSEQFLNI